MTVCSTNPFLIESFRIDREILTDERRERDETMWRENRRVQAMSWGSSGSDEPPPKPSRMPPTASHLHTNSSNSSSSTINRSGPSSTGVESAPGPTTYLVAPNSQVLAQLMRENESRSAVADAAMYTAPASAFNTFTVEFVTPASPPSSSSSSSPSSSSSSSSSPASPQHLAKGKHRRRAPTYANIVGPSTLPAAAAGCAGSTPLVRDVRITWDEMIELGIGMIAPSWFELVVAWPLMLPFDWLASLGLDLWFALPVAVALLLVFGVYSLNWVDWLVLMMELLSCS